MNIRKTSFDRFTDCYECAIGDTRLVITSDIGPRIVSLEVGKSGNIFFFDQKGTFGYQDWRIYGGTRLWLAPETLASYEPDNAKCTVHQNNDSITITDEGQGKVVTKSMTVSEVKGRFLISFKATNTSSMPLDFSLWAVTCVAPTGTVFFPWGSETPGWEMKKILYWDSWIDHSTNVRSPQYEQTRDLFLIKPNGEEGKVGTGGQGGFIGVTTEGYTFIKKFRRDPLGRYPDDGCACECYTCKAFVELETLSPIYTIMPNASAEFEEEWIVLPAKTDLTKSDELRALVRG
jgi:hypothetical protein